MALLEALAAFALTMLVFATIATMIVETGLRLLQQREKDYEAMLKRLGNDVLLPRLRPIVPSSVVDPVAAFVAAMRQNPGAGTPSASTVEPQLYAQPEDATAAKRGFLDRMWNLLFPKELTAITPAQFAERLAGTEFGQAIYKQARDVADTLVKDVAQKLENFGKAAGEYYARRAKTVCMAVSVLLAFAANVDGLTVMRTYFANEQVRSAVIARREQIETQHREAQEALKRAQDARKTAADASDPKLADAERLAQQALDRAKAAVRGLSDIGVPVGWNHFPHCPADDSRCQSKHFSDYLLWALATLVTGVLIGLGGPFWYDMVQGLSRVLALLRSLGGPPRTPEKPGDEGAPANAAAEQPRTPVEIFRVAAEAADTSKLRKDGQSLRPLLRPDGTLA